MISVEYSSTCSSILRRVRFYFAVSAFAVIFVFWTVSFSASEYENQ